MSPKPLEEQVPYTELPTFLEKKKSKQTDLNNTTEWMLLPINDLNTSIFTTTAISFGLMPPIVLILDSNVLLACKC